MAQSEYEVNEIESELISKKDELEYMNDYNDRTLREEIDLNLYSISLAPVAVIIARNQRFINK